MADPATMDAYAEAKKAMPGAMAEVQAIVAKAQALSAKLAKHGITLMVAPPKSGTHQ